jgi:cardiolipin synthase A/B
MMRIFFVPLLSSLLFLGCSPLGQYRQPPLLDEARIWINQTAALEVTQAYSADDMLYIRFNAHLKDGEQFKTFMAKTHWHPENLARSITISLAIIDETQWDERPKELLPVESLSKDHWRSFRFKLAHHLAPEEKKSGTVIRSDEDELILFYNNEELLQVIDIKEKPADIQIKETLTQEQLTKKIVDLMRSYLKEMNINADRVLLSLDNEDDYSNPFVYVDMERFIVLNLKLPLEDQKRQRANLLKKGIKSADYLLFDSYVLGMWKRPVTSSARLFSWTHSMTRDVIKPPSLALLENRSVAPLYKGEPMDLAAFEKKLERQVGASASFGSMDFLIGGDEFFTRLIDAVISAKKSIDVRIFIFDNDDYAVAIADLLQRKAEEGVSVRVILDGMGQVMGEGKLPEHFPPGFVPPASMEKYLQRDSAIKVRVRPNAWFKADHTKTIIIDEELFFTGGMNIGREYRYDWHDLMMEVRGPVVDEIIREFEIAWAHAGPWGDLGYLKTILNKPLSSVQQSGYPLRALYTRLNDPQIYKAQLLAIREANSYIYIHNSYFSDDTIIYELIKARRRGVDVRVILPIQGNHKVMNAGNIVSANTMFRNGIRVFLSHIKAAVYDGWLCTGSANFDKLSLIDNLELNIATSDKETVNNLLERLFKADFQKSKEMTELLEAGWKERLAEFLAEQL